MTTNGQILIAILICIAFGQYLNSVTAYNSILTYVIRYHKIKFLPNITGNNTIDQNKEQQYINGYLSLNFNASLNKAMFVINRCNPEGINCEYFQTWKLSNICTVIKEKNQIWSSILESLYPRFECPLQKHYRINNGSINFGPIIRWYPDATEYQWKVTIKGYSDDEYLGGLTLEFSIFGYRKRIKIALKK